MLSGASSISQDGARLDIAASGCWGGRHKKTYFDVRVFNPHAPPSLLQNGITIIYHTGMDSLQTLLLFIKISYQMHQRHTVKMRTRSEIA